MLAQVEHRGRGLPFSSRGTSCLAVQSLTSGTLGRPRRILGGSLSSFLTLTGSLDLSLDEDGVEGSDAFCFPFAVSEEGVTTRF